MTIAKLIGQCVNSLHYLPNRSHFFLFFTGLLLVGQIRNLGHESIFLNHGNTSISFSKLYLYDILYYLYITNYKLKELNNSFSEIFFRIYFISF